MDDTRKKLRVCLIFLVLVAVIIGCIYYFTDVYDNNHMSEGTLVMLEEGKG